MERIMNTAIMEFTGEDIIRCRDCAYAHNGSGRGLLCDYFMDSNKIPALVTPNGFCAWAERRDAR